MYRVIILNVVCLTLLWGCVSSAGKDTAAADDDVLLFASFRGNGEDGLHLAYSEDALNWIAINNDTSAVSPKVGTKLMRDPVIIRGPDERFHMVWTAGWQDRGIGLAHSDNLLEWSEQQFLPVMADFPTAKNAWAPEIYWDEPTQKYWIYWASTIPGRYPETEKQADKGWDHRIYATTTTDFEHYTPTELFYQPDFNVIDAAITQSDSGYIMLVKDETRYPPAKNLLVARSSAITGPWKIADKPFTPPAIWVEGPAIVEWRGWYYVYYDQYIDHSFGVMRTRDFVNWQNLTDELNMPQGSRHGSILKISRQELATLL